MPNEEENQDILQPEKLLIEVDGSEQWVDAYNLSNAAKFLGRSLRGLTLIIENQKKAGRPVPLWKPQIGRGTYIRVEDLKDLMRARPVED